MHGSGVFTWPDGKVYKGIQIIIFVLQVAILRTKRKDMVYLIGLMEEYTLVIGRMVNKMDMVYKWRKMEKRP